MKPIRKAARLTQKQLSEKSGVSRVVIARLETGATKASVETLVKLAYALGVSLDDLVAEKSAS